VADIIEQVSQRLGISRRKFSAEEIVNLHGAMDYEPLLFPVPIPEG